MQIDEIIFLLPTFVSVVGEKSLEKSGWCDEKYISSRVEHYERLERDLRRIQALVGQQVIKKVYRPLLRDQNSFWSTLHEIHGISLVSEISSRLRLKVPVGGSSKNDYDAQAWIDGIAINIECKTRRDEFPFNLPPIQIEEALSKLPVHSGSRATIDPHDAENMGIANELDSSDPLHRAIPEATEVRRILFDALSLQLPKTGINLILFGQISGDRENLETALFGPVVVDFWKNPLTREVESSAIRLPHGAYDAGPNGEPFRQLSAILWFKLFGMAGPEYKFYPNPYATSPLPKEVAASLESVIG